MDPFCSEQHKLLAKPGTHQRPDSDLQVIKQQSLSYASKMKRAMKLFHRANSHHLKSRQEVWHLSSTQDTQERSEFELTTGSLAEPQAKQQVLRQVSEKLAELQLEVGSLRARMTVSEKYLTSQAQDSDRVSREAQCTACNAF